MQRPIQWNKSYQSTQRKLRQRESAIQDLERLANAIDQNERLLEELRTELAEVSTRHANRSTTREDIAFLTDMLACAKKKLAWETQIINLRKRTPTVLAAVVEIANDEKDPPPQEMRVRILQHLQSVQEAMQRLDAAVGGRDEAPPES